jgi:tetratricopeptide (TPR) repeat protein
MTSPHPPQDNLDRDAGEAVTEESIAQAWRARRKQLQSFTSESEFQRFMAKLQSDPQLVHATDAHVMDMRAIDTRRDADTDSDRNDSATEPVDRLPDNLNAIGPYNLLRQIGRGGMAIVYEAVDPRIQRPVAIKIQLGLDTDEVSRQRFAREAKSLAKLSHPNILQIYDVGETESALPYIVTEYASEGNLRDAMRRETLPTRLMCEIVACAARGLDAAHQAGIVHRDIKPSNILIHQSTTASGNRDVAPNKQADSLSERGWVPKIADFGLARPVDQTSQITLSSVVSGTPAYMSPEQILDPKGIHNASDIYSLGVMLYELLTGETPFRGSSQAILHQIIQGDIPSPRRLNPSIPAALETICLHAMAFKPSQRYASAQSFADDLDSYLKGRPIRARPVTTLGRLQRWCDRHRGTAALSALSALLLVCLTVGGWIAAGSVRSAYQQTLQTNNQLTQAIQESNAAFELSQDTLQAIVVRARDELYNVPQATQLVVQMSQDSASLQRRLLALRPDDLRSAQSLVETLDYLADAEWTLGNIDKSRAATDELEALLIDARKRHPNHFDFETAWCSLLIERVMFPTPDTSEERQNAYTKQMDQALAVLQAQFPDRAAIAKLAMEHAKCEATLAKNSKDDARLLSTCLKAYEAAEKLVELSPGEEKERSALWQAQTAQVLGYYYLKREHWGDAESWFARATRSMEANPLTATDREAKYFAAIIALGYGKARIGAGQPSSASSMLDDAVERFANLVADFPEDAKYRMDWIESLLARVECRWSQQETDGATVDWKLANEQFPQLSGSSLTPSKIESLQSRLESLRDRMQK